MYQSPEGTGILEWTCLSMVDKQKSGTKVSEAMEKPGEGLDLPGNVIFFSGAGSDAIFSGTELQSGFGFSLLPAGTQFNQENQSAGNEYGKGD